MPLRSPELPDGHELHTHRFPSAALQAATKYEFFTTIRRRAKMYRLASTLWAKKCWAKKWLHFFAHAFFCPEHFRF